MTIRVRITHEDKNVDIPLVVTTVNADGTTGITSYLKPGFSRLIDAKPGMDIRISEGTPSDIIHTSPLPDEKLESLILNAGKAAHKLNKYLKKNFPEYHRFIRKKK